MTIPTIHPVHMSIQDITRLVGEGKSLHLSGPQSEAKMVLLNILLSTLVSDGDKKIAFFDENYYNWSPEELKVREDHAALVTFYKPFNDPGWQALHTAPHAMVVNGDNVMRTLDAYKTNTGRHVKEHEVISQQEEILFFAIETGHQVVSSSSFTVEDMDNVLKTHQRRPTHTPIPFNLETHIAADFNISQAQQNGLTVFVQSHI